MNYKGIIIEESLNNKDILHSLKITKTDIEPITPKHQTPWLKQWTLHSVEVTEDTIEQVVEKLSHSFDIEHPDWYADLKNNQFHYLIFANKVFKVDLSNPTHYKDAKSYGKSIGIPEYQLDFV
jgi:hypothetical protein